MNALDRMLDWMLDNKFEAVMLLIAVYGLLGIPEMYYAWALGMY